MYRNLICACVCILLIFTGNAVAHPTFTGPTGIITLPNADVAPGGQWTLSADLFIRNKGGASQPNVTSIRALYGMGDIFEVGIGHRSGGNDTWTLHGKYNTPINGLGCNWAFGLIYDDSRMSGDDSRITQYYIAGSRIVEDERPGAPRLKTTIGVNLTEFVGGPFPAKKTIARPFASGEMFFPSGVTAGIEAQAPNKSALGEKDAVWGAIIRCPVDANSTVRLSYVNWDSFRTTGHGSALVGLDYSF